MIGTFIEDTGVAPSQKLTQWLRAMCAVDTASPAATMYNAHAEMASHSRKSTVPTARPRLQAVAKVISDSSVAPEPVVPPSSTWTALASNSGLQSMTARVGDLFAMPQSNCKGSLEEPTTIQQQQLECSATTTKGSGLASLMSPAWAGALSGGTSMTQSVYPVCVQHARSYCSSPSGDSGDAWPQVCPGVTEPRLHAAHLVGAKLGKNGAC
jgi:hypothetical protein